MSCGAVHMPDLTQRNRITVDVDCIGSNKFESGPIAECPNDMWKFLEANRRQC